METRETHAKSASRCVMSSKNQRLHRGDEHVSSFVVHRGFFSLDQFPSLVRSNSVIDGVEFGIVFLRDGCWPTDNSLVHESTYILVEGASILPFCIVPTRAHVVKIS